MKVETVSQKDSVRQIVLKRWCLWNQHALKLREKRRVQVIDRERVGKGEEGELTRDTNIPQRS